MENEYQNIEKLAKYEFQDWIIWLKALFNYEAPNPNFVFGELPLDRKVIWIKNLLEEQGHSTEILSKAVFALFFEYVDNKNNPESVYFLIQLLAIFKNQEYAPQLELIFIKDKLQGVSYKEINLNMVLLNCLISFSSINDLTGYFNQSLDEQHPELFYLLGLKYFYKTQHSKMYFNYLDDVVEKYVVNDNTSIIAAGIVNNLNEVSFNKKNNNEIFNWWINNADKIKQINPKFHKNIASEFSKWLHNKNKTVAKDSNLLRLKMYNDSILMENVSFFPKYIIGISERKSESFQDFENDLKVTGAYIKDINFDPWERAIILDSSPSNEPEGKEAIAYKKICLASARYHSIKARLSKEDRSKIKHELCN